MPRPKKEIDPAMVEALAKIQCTMPEIAAVLNCSQDTLERRFAAVIEKGRQEGKMSLKRQQYQIAMKGNVAMLIWLGKQHLGQSEKLQADNTNRTIEADDGSDILAHVARLAGKPAAGRSNGDRQPANAKG